MVVHILLDGQKEAALFGDPQERNQDLGSSLVVYCALLVHMRSYSFRVGLPISACASHQALKERKANVYFYGVGMKEKPGYNQLILSDSKTKAQSQHRHPQGVQK